MSEPRPVGRPTDYREEYCQKLIDHMQQGYSFESFSATIGVHRGTLYDWEHRHPEFADAKKRAVEVCQYTWEQMGQQGMRTSGPFNASVWIFNMKNRFKWHDNVQVSADIKTEDKKDERLNQVLNLLQSEFKK